MFDDIADCARFGLVGRAGRTIPLRMARRGPGIHRCGDWGGAGITTPAPGSAAEGDLRHHLGPGDPGASGSGRRPDRRPILSRQR